MISEGSLPEGRATSSSGRGRGIEDIPRGKNAAWRKGGPKYKRGREGQGQAPILGTRASEGRTFP